MKSKITAILGNLEDNPYQDMQAPHAPQGNLSSSFRAMSDQRFGYTSPTWLFLGGLIFFLSNYIPSPTMHFCRMRSCNRWFSWGLWESLRSRILGIRDESEGIPVDMARWHPRVGDVNYDPVVLFLGAAQIAAAGFQFTTHTHKQTCSKQL